MMEKNQVVASIIMESALSQPKISDIKKDNINGIDFLRFYTNLQDFNVFNRNGRNYKGSCMKAGLSADHITELMQEGAWCGEFGHPLGKDVDVARILTIDPKLISHRMTSIDVTDVNVKGWVETLCNKWGREFRDLILQGFEPAFSLRALAQVTRKGQRQFIESTPRIVTYDAVILPSHKMAYRDKNVTIKKVCKNLEDDGNILYENVVTPLIETQIKDLIALESVNVGYINDFNDVCLKNMELTSDLSAVILREGNVTYKVNIEDKIKADVTSYLKSLY